VAAVAQALDAGGLFAGRAAVSRIVGRDPESLDEHGVARAAIESLAENFSDGVVAPALYYALFGLPGIFVYKTANTLDSMIGHKTPRHLHFGWAAARLDDLLNLVPARLSGLFLAAAALVTREAQALPALRTMLRDAKKHRSPNAGWPEAAAAGALGLALAGPRRYHGYVVDDPWLGDGHARATSLDIVRALRLYLAACVLQATLILAVYLIIVSL
jgi:adenosylcobinamide-phosphate synthase